MSESNIQTPFLFGFSVLLRKLLFLSGLKSYCNQKLELPFYFQPELWSLQKGSNVRSTFKSAALLFVQVPWCSDEFRTGIANFPRGSVCGYSMLSLDLHTEKRTSVSSIRKFSLKSPGFSTNHVIDAMIPDILVEQLMDMSFVTTTERFFVFLWVCVALLQAVLFVQRG